MQKETYANNLVFQGTMDSLTWTDIWRVDASVHEGWNYKSWKDTPSDAPNFTVYRFLGNATGSCVINEIKFAGIKTIDNNDASYSCPATLIVDDVSTDLMADVTYGLTAALDSIEPRFGPVTGGTSVTFTGTGFSANQADYSIVIDGIDCPVSGATGTSVTCDTGSRPGLIASSLLITIAGSGLVSTKGLLYRYSSAWSDDTTWGGEYAPVDGESVYVPAGLNLLVDVDKSPILNAVIVEGSLTFAPDLTDPLHEREFDAHYIFMNKGTMEVGTEDFPYTSKLQITMHGNVYSPYIPTFGNKVIGVK